MAEMAEMSQEAEPLISVIVPVYGVEKYLGDCIRSIRAQTYEHLEIILVDDGSPDCCGALCDEAARKDPRIRVLHKENGGLSDARNAGTAIARGSYITFIDSDDAVEPDYVACLYGLIARYHTRMSLCCHALWRGSRRQPLVREKPDEVLGSHECLRRMLYHQDIDTSAWAKLYEAELCRQIPYPVGMHYEDIGTTYRFFLASQDIACSYRALYNYRIREDSIVTGQFSKKKLDLLTMTDEMAENVSAAYPDLAAAILRRRVYARFSTLNQMLGVKTYREERDAIVRFIRQHAREVLRDPLTPRRDRLAIRLLCHGGLHAYSAAWRLYLRMKK